MTEQTILDMCCGSRMFWFDKQDERAVLGETKPRLKTRKEITKALEGVSGEYAAALRWVLGEAQ